MIIISIYHKLILLAQGVDMDFHWSIQDIFNIDKVTNEAIIPFDDHFEGEERERERDNI